MRSRCARAFIAAWVGVATAWAPSAKAQDDGVYGRFDGDLELSAGAGVGVADGGPLLGLSAAALYLSTAGTYVHYTDALGSEDLVHRRAIASGVQLRPLFLGRWGRDLERGPARLDLWLDSLALLMGAVWEQPHDGGFQSAPGFELAVLSEFPILPDATGPFIGLRGALRFRDRDLEGRGDGNVVSMGALLNLCLSWHQVVGVHLVDAGDTLQR